MKTTITYSAEILNNLLRRSPDLTMISANYLANGCEAKVRDSFDNQLYVIKVIPLYERDDISIEDFKGQ